MRKLIKESFYLWVKMLWLKKIDKETSKYNKIETRRKRQSYIIHSLMKKYNEIYSTGK